MNVLPRLDQSGCANSRDSSKKKYRALPNPKFEGCWCCGEKGHSRAQCKEFQRVRAANGGKVPRDYEGAYEKHMKKSGKQIVSPISVTTDEPEDHEETTLLWPLIRSPPPRPTVTSNKFADLCDSEDSDDDESEMLKALAQLTSKISTGPKQTQSQKKKKGKKMNMTRVLAVAKKIRNGELTLPDLKLESNDEYDAAWALVDTGAGVNCASRKQFPDAVPVNAPEVQLTTAGGKNLPNKGAMRVTTVSQEGIVRERIFYDAPVDMPIISIAEESKQGKAGSSALFRRLDGFIEDDATKERQHFVKRKGVYFMKVFIKRKKALESELGFARPGPLP